MRKKVERFFSFLVIAILAFSILFANKVDKTLLLENKNVGFFEYFASNKLRKVTVVDNDKTFEGIRFNILKKDLNKITRDDYHFLCRMLNSYRNIYSWVSLYFYDGTGIQFMNCDPNNALYGEIDEYGRVIKVLNIGKNTEEQLIFFNKQSSENIGISGIEEKGSDINGYLDQIDDLLCYLEALESKDYIIFIAANDDCAGFLRDSAQVKLKELGLKMDFSQVVRKSYLAIIENEQVLLEETSKNLIKKSGDIANIQYSIESAGAEAGKYASIFIDGRDYSSHWRGLNFAVYSVSEKQVIDYVAFDTYSENWDCKRIK